MYKSTNTEVPVFFTALTATELTRLIEEVILRLQPEKYEIQNQSLDPNELLTRIEAAKEFKVCIATIDNYRRRGFIVSCRIAGIVRFKRSDLQAAFSGSILNPYKVPKAKRV